MPLTMFINRSNQKPVQHDSCSSRAGFSLVEMLVTISVIGLLVGLTLTAFSGVDGTEQVLKSKNNLRQIHTWVQNYANNHRDRVVPSQFDYYDENGVELGEIASATGYIELTNQEPEWVPSNNLYGTTGNPRIDLVSQGTWADILWVETNLGDDVGLADFPLLHPTGGMGSGPSNVMLSYRYRAPNRHAYDYDLTFDRNPLRSVAPNTYNFPRYESDGTYPDVDYNDLGASSSNGPMGLPKPFGGGAWEKGLPGFFAANNFFDARSHRDQTGDLNSSSVDRYVTHSQIIAPSKSMYLVDSFAGLTIGGNSSNEDETAKAFAIQDFDDVAILNGSKKSVRQEGDAVQEVDLRYAGGEGCLMLFLDGHIEMVSRFSGLNELQGVTGGQAGRGIRVTDLDRRKSEVNPSGVGP
ncbi:MAG: type II secretion system protein [Planctomycetota bacterium]|nr:type II secretion system protein [Planctomycetota bacterium]